MNGSDQNVEFVFGDNNNYHQIGNSYLEFDITVRREDNANFDDNSAIRLVNNAFAFCFKEARLSTTSGGDLEQNKFVGKLSTILRAITSEDGDLLWHFDKINEKTGTGVVTADNIKSTSLKKMLINNHQSANKGKIRSQLPLEHLFGFCKTFIKITKNLGFHLTFKRANLQDIIYTTLADSADQINVTIKSLYLYIPFLFPNTEPQLMFIELSKIILSYLMMIDIQKEELLRTQYIKSILVQLNLSIAQNI